MKDPQLWNGLESLNLDDSDAEFTFSQRLARENGWFHEYSLSVVEEYKKFIYLCCVTNMPVTPSDQVDQAWHLHMTYTKSYWFDMCQDILGRPVHHNPTKGGDGERMKYANCYELTLQWYKEEFGESPPRRIWPDKGSRFKNIQFERVNKGEFWIVRKPSLRVMAFVNVMCLLLVSFIFIQSEDSFPWIGLIVVFIAVAFIVRAFRGGGGSGGGSSGGCWGCSTDSGCSASGCGGCGGD